MGNNCLGRSTAEKDLGVRVDHKLNTSQQCDTVAKQTNIILRWDALTECCKQDTRSNFSTLGLNWSNI